MSTIGRSAKRELRSLGDREFALLRAFIRAECGIELSSRKKALVEGRLNRRLRVLGLNSYNDYYLRLLHDDGAERQIMLDCITTNETYFFRQSTHFELLEKYLIPRWRRDAHANARSKRIRVWSAGCSTGEEPYSIGMCLRSALPPSEGWSIEILASDISLEVLDRASSGVYPIEQATRIPQRCLEKFFLRGRGSEAGKMKVRTDLRSMVKFGRLNLNAPRYGFRQPFDLILCRNVLIYFGREEKMRVVHRFLDLLVEDGLLMLGHAESLQGETDRVRCVCPSVYSLIGVPKAAAYPRPSKAAL